MEKAQCSAVQVWLSCCHGRHCNFKAAFTAGCEFLLACHGRSKAAEVVKALMEKVEVEGRDKLAGFCLRWLHGRDSRLRCAAAQVPASSSLPLSIPTSV